MSPILGIWASQNYPRNNNSYESIATVTAGVGGVSSASFTSIPQTYKHLQIRMTARDTGGTTPDIVMQYNGDTGQNYARHYLYGTGSAAVTSGNAIGTNNWVEVAYSGGTTSSIYAVSITDILDYTSTSKTKVNRTLTGIDPNNSGYIILYSGLWNSTAAITSLTINPSGGSFAQYSSIALYGIKG